MAFTGTISHESRTEIPRAITEEAIHCAEQVRAQKDALGASRLMKAFEISDGYQVYVLDMEHVQRVHVIPPIPIFGGEEEDEFSIDKELYPSLTIAGVVSGGASVTTLDFHQEDGEGGIRPWTGWYVKNDAVSLMPDTAELFSREEVAYKVGVQENPIFAPFRGFTELTFSQFAMVEPGNYTGGMAPIVQLLMGVGKLLDRDYEDRWVEADLENRFYATLLNPEDLGLEEDEQPVSFYNNKEAGQVQISYDYRWHRTHGIMWGTNNQGQSAAMLVELGQRGVHVMPFPVDELSVLPEIQDQYLRVYPALGQYQMFRDGSETLFEAFGGFPTGERMAGTADELEREIRAGYVIAADRELEKFYEGLPMCTGFGWAFHDSQPAAINTGYRYNGVGQKVGYCEEVRLTITEKAENQKVRNTVTGAVISALGLTKKVDLHKAKLLPQDFAEEMVEDPDYDEFDAFEVSPDWIVWANIYRLREGIIDYQGFQCPKFEPCGMIHSPQFKYFEPALAAVMHFEFEKANKDVPIPKRSDGPIFATYVNGSAEILSYFNEPPEIVSYSGTTRQYCQYEGDWQNYSYSESKRLQGYFYTSSRDFRKYFDKESGQISHITGSRHGSYDFLAFCAFFAMAGDITKRFIGSQTYQIEIFDSDSKHVAVSCASNNRSMFFVCEERRKANARYIDGYTGFQEIGRNGARRRLKLYNFIFHWTGVCSGPDDPKLGDPACHAVNGPVIIDNPDSCHGTAPPAPVEYSVCCVNNGKIGGCFAGSDLVVRSPADNAVIQSAAVTRRPTGPPSWSTSTPPQWEFEYEIWAFGHPLMHNRRIRRVKEVITERQEVPQHSSDGDWWRCSIPGECPAYPWRVVSNYYGPAYVGTNEEFGFGWVEYGRKPQVGGRFFGVVS